MISYILTLMMYCDNIKGKEQKLECFNKYSYCLKVDNKNYKSGCVSTKKKESK